jgi:hypothetical protein
MKPKNLTATKGMAFAGCSFTWGQSLWYYSNLETVIEQEYNTYDPQHVYFTHRAFTEANRYPRLVARHFNQFELCQPFNGGSNSTIIDYWQNYALAPNTKADDKKITNRGVRGPVYDVNDISYFIVQFTQWSRSDIKIIYKDITYGPTQRWSLFSDKQDVFYGYLEDNNIGIDRFYEECKREDVSNIKNFLLRLESQGICVLVLTWPSDLVPFIQQDSWLNDKLIKLHYDNKNFTSIGDLISAYPTMRISGDTDFFIEPPKDDHPSLKCHRVIADSIIRHIENEKTK